jgi:ribose 5-phosphate isomerase RpiB
MKGVCAFKIAKDKQIVVGAEFTGFPLTEAVVTHLKSKGWEVLDFGVRSADEQNPEMFHHFGLKFGERIADANMKAH